MPVKSFPHPVHGTVSTGCNPPPHPPKRLFKKYLDLKAVSAAFPGTPNIDYTRLAALAVRQINLNATLGCCVPAGQEHSSGIFTGNANGGSPDIFTDAQTEANYTGMSGGVFDPANAEATDQGCDPETALAWQVKNGLLADGSHKIVGWMGIDATSELEIRYASAIFQSPGLALELPDQYVNPVPSQSGFIWDVAGDPDPENGHWIVGGGDTDQGLIVLTWAMQGIMTYPAIAKYCMPASGGNLYMSVSQDSLVKAMNKIPFGLDWAQLVADFNEDGGNISLEIPT